MMWTKVLLQHFVISVRWHCTHLMNFVRLNEGIDRAVRVYVTFDQNSGQNV